LPAEQEVAVSPQGDDANPVAPTDKETLKVLETFRVSLMFNAKIHAEIMYGKKV